LRVVSQEVMGTVVSIHLDAGTLPEPEVEAAIGSACGRFRQLDETLSTWKPDSPHSRLRRGALELEEAPVEIHAVIELCRRARQLTAGWFDPWAMPGGFDPTGLVKGWAAEEALEALEAAGITDAMVNAGGDVAVIGLPAGEDSWRIGIAHPWRRGALACVVEVAAAVATSGTYERAGHLVDPTGRSPEFAASATVTGGELWLCDAVATAAAVGLDEVLELVAELDGYEAYLIRSDGSEASTESFPFVPA
jgi:thiamine biosynthesis lipoprotein